MLDRCGSMNGTREAAPGFKWGPICSDKQLMITLAIPLPFPTTGRPSLPRQTKTTTHSPMREIHASSNGTRAAAPGCSAGLPFKEEQHKTILALGSPLTEPEMSLPLEPKCPTCRFPMREVHLSTNGPQPTPTGFKEESIYWAVRPATGLGILFLLMQMGIHCPLAYPFRTVPIQPRQTADPQRFTTGMGVPGHNAVQPSMGRLPTIKAHT